MAKPVNLVIKPPYNGWTLVHGFGSVSDPTILHTHALLEKSGAAEVFAAFRGRLSARPPGSNTNDPQEDTTPAATSPPLPETVKLYLHILPPAFDSNPSFRSALYLHVSPINEPDEEPGPTAAADLVIRFEEITSFVYLNLDPSSLEEGLAELLPFATTPRDALPPAEVVKQLVNGTRDVIVPAGHLIGRASGKGAPAGSVLLGLTVLTDWAAHDPAHVYDWLRDFVDEGQPEVDAFLQLVPKTWPLLSPLLSKSEAITVTGGTTYPWSVLQELKMNLRLDRDWEAEPGQPLKSSWRRVGDNQKRLWRNRLLMRTGHHDSSSRPFEFNDLDSLNLFQLEAVTEFFANFEVSWNAATQQEVKTIREPDTAGYVTVDFLNPSGPAATVSGKVVTLDGEPDLSRLQRYVDDIDVPNITFSYRDCIDLPGAIGNQGKKLYRITAVDNVTKQVTVEADEDLTFANGSSRWTIRLRPFIVIIDSFGGRISGDAATVADQTVTLDGNDDLSKINKDFDTVYFSSDIARPSRTYRIRTVPSETRTLTLDGTPDFGGSASNWHIPAGVSGELPAMPYNLGPGGTKGYDHYDGVIFVVYNNEIKPAPIRWSSYTSRDNTGEARSSLLGNQVYDYFSFRSTNAFKHYSLGITDPEAAYDGVRKALFYFETIVQGDICPPDQIPEDGPNQPGKTRIRIHQGVPGAPTAQGSGSGSDGCSVSPSFTSFRDMLIDIYQDEYRALHPGSTGDAAIEDLEGRDHNSSMDFWGEETLTNALWDHKIVGPLWLIRPDERPLMVAQ